MQIDRRITNGLAWAGVLLVVGVPTADLLSAQFFGNPETTPAQVAVIEPVAHVAPTPAPLSQRPAAPVQVAAKPAETAPVVAAPVTQVAVAAPAKPAAPVVAKPAAPTTQTAGVVDNYLQSGKPMPSYITGAPSAAPAAAAPAQVAVAKPVATQPTRIPIVTTPAGIDPIQVASIPQTREAPVPMPLSMRPRPVINPLAVAPSEDIFLPPSVTRQQPANIVPRSASVTAEELEDWENGPLEEFLAARQQQRRGNAGMADDDYDADGFFLDEGPQQRGDRYIGPANSFFPFFAD